MAVENGADALRVEGPWLNTSGGHATGQASLGIGLAEGAVGYEPIWPATSNCWAAQFFHPSVSSRASGTVRSRPDGEVVELRTPPEVRETEIVVGRGGPRPHAIQSARAFPSGSGPPPVSLTTGIRKTQVPGALVFHWHLGLFRKISISRSLPTAARPYEHSPPGGLEARRQGCQLHPESPHSL